MDLDKIQNNSPKANIMRSCFEKFRTFTPVRINEIKLNN